MGQWLVRTDSNVILGPFEEEQIRELIRKRELGLDDEICPANSYWFALQEFEEVRAHLGVEVPAPLRIPSVDATVTQIEGKTDPGYEPEDSNLPHSQRSRQQRRFGLAVNTRADGTFTPVIVGEMGQMGQMERYTFWKAVVWLLAAVAFALIISVLRILRSV